MPMRGQSSLSPLQWLIAFAIAVGIWTYVALHSEYTFTIALPITYELPSDFAFGTLVPDSLTLNIRGAGFELLNFLINPPAALRLSFVGLQHDTVLTISQTQLHRLLPLHRNVDLLNIFPSTLHLVIGKTVAKKIPVEVPLQIHVADQFILAAPPKISPDSVIVRGHPSIVDTLRRLTLPPIHVYDVSEPFSLPITLAYMPEYYLSVTPRTAQLSVDIQMLAEYTLWDLPIRTPRVPQKRYDIRPTRLRLTVRGGLSYIENFLRNPLAVEVTLPLPRVLAHQTGMIYPKIYLPPNLHLLSASPRALGAIRRVSYSPTVLLSPRPFYPVFVQAPQ